MSLTNHLCVARNFLFSCSNISKHVQEQAFRLWEKPEERMIWEDGLCYRRRKDTRWQREELGGIFLLSSLNKLERRLLFLFGALAYSWLFTQRGTHSSFTCFIQALLCVRQEKTYVLLAYVKICLYMSSFFFLSSLKYFCSDCSSSFHSSILLNCCWHPTFKRRGKGGKVPDDKSQWEC